MVSNIEYEVDARDIEYQRQAGKGSGSGSRLLLLTFKGTRQVEALTIDKDNHVLKPATVGYN